MQKRSHVFHLPVFYLLVFCLTLSSARGQSFRGLAPLNDTVCWVSGSKGTVLKTENGGLSWDTISPAGFATKEFRDIHVYSHTHAIVMSSGDSAVILRTRDGGKSWQTVHSNDRPGVFYDAMDAFGPFVAVIGDPYKHQDSNYLVFDIQYSCDSGETWACEKFKKRWERAEEGEALFAASGTNIVLDRITVKGGRKTFNPLDLYYTFVTGGLVSHFFRSGKKNELPFDTCASCGAYSHARTYEYQIVIVGGNYLKPDQREKTCVYYDREEKSFLLAHTPPYGYRSSVANKFGSDLWVCTGTNGTDISKDDGKTWSPLPLEGYNSCAFSKNFLWLCGDKGRVLRALIPG